MRRDNQPASGQDGAAWLHAAGLAQTSLAAMKGVLDARLPEYSCAGHLAVPLGAVVGGDESRRGAAPYQLLRQPLPNPHPRGDNSPVQETRRTFAKKIQSLLGKQRRPQSFPAVLVHCNICRPTRIHDIDDPACPVNTKTLAAL